LYFFIFFSLTFCNL